MRPVHFLTVLAILCGTALAQEQDSPNYLFYTYVNRGDTFARRGDHGAALQAYQEALRYRDDYRVHEWIGDIYDRTGRSPEAFTAFGNALRTLKVGHGDGSAEAETRLREKIERLAREDPALLDRLSKEDLEIFGLEFERDKKKKLEEIRHLRWLLAQQQVDPPTLPLSLKESVFLREKMWKSRAWDLFAQADHRLMAGDVQGAIGEYRVLVRDFPEEPMFWERLGDAHTQVGEDDEARRAYNQAVLLHERLRERVAQKRPKRPVDE